MQQSMKPTVRVLGAMLLAHEYDSQEICVLGYPLEVSKSSRQFTLKTTDQKQIPVVLQEPLTEYLDGIIQIRGKFDGQRLQVNSYNMLLPEISGDFDDNTYNEAVKLLRT